LDHHVHSRSLADSLNKHPHQNHLSEQAGMGACSPKGQGQTFDRTARRGDWPSSHFNPFHNLSGRSGREQIARDDAEADLRMGRVSRKSESSVIVPHQFDLGVDDAIVEGSTAGIRSDLIGGESFKIAGMTLCSR
jgi:hypothetical protein